MVFIRINNPNFFLLVLTFELTNLVQVLGLLLIFDTIVVIMVLGPRPIFWLVWDTFEI
jgi:hypothetical protein